MAPVISPPWQLAGFWLWEVVCLSLWLALGGVTGPLWLWAGMAAAICGDTVSCIIDHLENP